MNTEPEITQLLDDTRSNTVAPYPIQCYFPRDVISKSVHSEVDLALKDLKSSGRRLHSCLTSQTEEYLILKRIYYKGKNQHRAALFWRHLVAIRRFCDRLERYNLSGLFTTLQDSFWGPENSNSASRKGPWTHCPDEQLVQIIVGKFDISITLLGKMKETLLNAYQHFIMNMRSGAFLQLLLALIAIASRMYTLISELLQDMIVVSSIARRVLVALHISRSNNQDAEVMSQLRNDLTTIKSDTQGVETRSSSNDAITVPSSAIIITTGRSGFARGESTDTWNKPEHKKTGTSGRLRKSKTRRREEEDSTTNHKKKKIRTEIPDEIDAIFGA